ncbi:S-adenosylmethionine mitochondrial carrier protein [Tolypocladium ophioglossoides CBS 100239]|uniref:S-adenosylmethionine mitochondrial carrier protein n=1 Tax=Tolypocladium ophioglossoides (strain CBS 100239) TaxID=1163406 RepID=A0A0L0N0Z6_TOLOC|nr:S-adenosylmethionine mitochondrial carrier protein [Tolypocladium ophioglossoides CBS 100239]
MDRDHNAVSLEYASVCKLQRQDTRVVGECLLYAGARYPGLWAPVGHQRCKHRARVKATLGISLRLHRSPRSQSSMSFGAGAEVWQAATVATLATDVLIHPAETLITRIQSPSYTTQYKALDGSHRRTFFRGLYQGFGPTVVAGVPASAAFFTAYEGISAALRDNAYVPAALAPALGSAAGEAVACAIVCPAEVLKQNAQVSRAEDLRPGMRSHTAAVMGRFARRPARLWAGYTALVAGHLPGTCLTFCLYELFKGALLSNRGGGESVARQVEASSASAGLAGGLVACLFVPVDVVRTRIRLAAGEVSDSAPGRSARSRAGPLAVAKGILRTEGVPGLFRGFTLTCVAAAAGSGLYLGCYEGGKMYFRASGGDDADAAEFAG